MGQAQNAGGKQEIATKVEEELLKDNKRFGEFCKEKRYEVPTAFGPFEVIIREKREGKTKKTLGKEKGKIRYEKDKATTLGRKI